MAVGDSNIHASTNEYTINIAVGRAGGGVGGRGPVNTTSNEGMTALHVAVRSQNATFVRYLLDKGARTDITDASGRTPLDVLNGVRAYQPAVFADAEGVVPPNPNAAPATPAAPAPAGGGRGGGAGGRGGGNPAAVQEIRAVLQGASSSQPQ